jgi:hypothetical protein
MLLLSLFLIGSNFSPTGRLFHSEIYVADVAERINDS